MLTLKQYQVTEITFKQSFTDYYSEFLGVFTCENHSISVPAYCKGQENFGIHFSPDRIGEWSYSIIDQVTKKVVQSDKLICIPCDENALVPLSIKQTDIRPIFWEGNKPHFIKAYECNWLFALWMSDRSGAKRLLRKICDNDFNTICINIYAHSCDWTKPETKDRLVPPPIYCFGESNENPNFDVMNEEFFSQLDELFLYLQEIKLYTYTYYFVYNKNVSYPPRDSKQEQMYIKYICARYQAYPNVVWDYAKELYFNSNKQNAINGMKLIRATDGYKRLLTFHDDKQLMHNKEARDLTDFHTIQQHSGFYEYTSELVFNDGRPVFHSEFGYEPGEDLDDITYTEAQNVREFLMRAWDVALALAGICYYYTFTGWDVIRPDDVPPGYAMFKILHNFMDSFDWENYIPAIDVPMWTPSRCIKHKSCEKYVFKTNHHGGIMLDYPLEKTNFKGKWLNPFTGETAELALEHLSIIAYNPDATVFTSPFATNLSDDYSILELEIL